MFKGLSKSIATIAAGLLLAATGIVPSVDALSIRAVVTPADSGATVKNLFAGSTRSCAILSTGHLKCWGSNYSGELGYGDVAMRGDGPHEMGDFLETIDLGSRRRAKVLAMGDDNTCAILDNGKVKCWGQNTYGQLGYGNTNHRGDNANEMGNNLPYVSFGSGRKAKALASGSYHTCALVDNGTVKCWGQNTYGQLGYGDTNHRGDNANEMGNNLPAVNLGRKAKALAAGLAHTCALLDNGTVKCWGRNTYGQLGYGNTENLGDDETLVALPTVNLGTGRTAKVITAGYAHSCALLDNRTVKCWGSNSDGQLGQGDTESRGDQPGEMGNLLPAVQLGTGRAVRSLVTGGLGWHNCTLLDNGAYKCWGYNDGSGTLGLGDAVNHGDNAGEMGDDLDAINVGAGRAIRSIVGGSDHSCALLSDATVMCWGWNNQGQLGYGNKDHLGDDEAVSGIPAVNLGVRVRAIHVAYETGCAILENRSLQCWGYNNRGQVGLGDTNHRGDEPGEMGDSLGNVDLGTGRTVKALPVTANYSEFVCAILDNGALKCWGSNSRGQLGYGDTDNRGDGSSEMGDNLAAVDLGVGRTAAAVATGDTHTCALLDNGTVKCWGGNGRGQLGYEDTIDRGDGAGEMGINLPTVNLGTGRKAKAIAAGGDHTCALLDNGTVKCWGENGQGQLGYGDQVNRGDSADAGHRMGSDLPIVNLGTRRRAKAITAGSNHTCALLDNGTVKCWGDGRWGKTGYGDTNDRGDEDDEMGNDLDVIDLGTGRRAKVIAASYDQTCAILDNGSLKCWGFNGEGQLGYGDNQARGNQDEEMGDFLPAVAVGGSRRVLSVSVGAFVCVLLDDYSVRCWGYNGEGELGQGDTSDRGDGPNEMGSYLKPVPFTG